MVRRTLGCAFAAVLILVNNAGVCGAPKRIPTASDMTSAAAQARADIARMEQVIQSFVASKKFMGAVVVARGNEKLLDKGYGYADLEWNAPDSPQTKFRLGSITKQFTAASILLLEERGKLNVHDAVKKYLPDAPPAWDKIAIFNLLTHTSGIPNFTSFPDYRSHEPFPVTPEQLVARFRDKPLDFQPGTKWSYSNSGYALLGYLIEKISDESYAQFVQQNIFKPLGMDESGYDSNSAIIPDRASGYVPGPDGFTNAGYINMTVPFSAGGLYSTTGDLLRWEQGLFGGKLLSPASLKEMTTPFKHDYAFGLVVHKVNGHELIDHGGGIEGFNTMLAYYPDDKLTVVVLANLNGSAPEEIAQDLATLAFGGTLVLPSERKQVHIGPKIFDGYVGSYQLAPDFILTVTRDGDHFITQATGQGQVEIFPSSDHDFFANVVDAQITFVTDKLGRATELILHQGGRDQHAPRVEAAAAAMAPKAHQEVHVDPKIFDGYVGSYRFTPDFAIAITREGDHLFEQATGQEKFEIFPEGEKDYFLKVVDAQITFVTDRAGRATELILHQGGHDQHAKRIE
ncbi:MAG TPA: serine hydrolase [Terriglobia bacterium]|nr:serine hydrolase [Terriglobia bacterium]